MTLPLEVLSPALPRINDLTPYFMAQTRSRAAGAFVAIFPLTAEFGGNKLMPTQHRATPSLPTAMAACAQYGVPCRD